MAESRGVISRRGSKGISIGVVVILVVLAFIAGNRFRSVGDWFFAPYGNKNNQALKEDLDTESVQALYDLLKQKYDGTLDSAKLEDGIKEGLVAATGDPYTVYLSPDKAAEFAADMNGSFSGIGAELGKRKDKVVVIAPLDGSPALQAGVKAGDIIVAIDGEDSTSFTVEEAVNKIRGQAGTKVKLGLIRGDKALDVEITRDNISVPSVTSSVLGGNIGYLKISRFSNDTASLSTKAAQEFKQAGVKGVIVDVRNNGGGLLDSAVGIAGLWLDNKVVVQEREGERVVKELRSERNPILEGVPTIVLVNEGSASASEILAGALSDHKAAKLLGEKTFGKGSVQELIDLPSGGQLKVTIARWFTPGGKNIDKEGIKPEIEVKRSVEDYEAERDPQKDQAVQELSK